MKKPKPKPKQSLPPWVPIVVIVAVMVIIVVVYMAVGGSSKPKPHNVSAYQQMVNEGAMPPFLSRQRLEGMGVKFPPNFDELAAQRAASGKAQPRMLPPGAQRGPMPSGQ